MKMPPEVSSEYWKAIVHQPGTERNTADTVSIRVESGGMN